MKQRWPLVVTGMVAMFVATVAIALSPSLNRNELTGHASPYLAMHGQDPVRWRDWGPQVLASARDNNQLIFISSGYFSCHWCHVMQRESYQDPGVAALLDAGFVSVKIDRELLPALDAHLIDFVERTQGQAGWPLNVILTPDGYPIIGFTYLPRDRFASVLKQIGTLWRDDREELLRLSRAALAELVAARSAAQPSPMVPPPPAAWAELLSRQAIAIGAEVEGGFGQQNKFPMSPQLLALFEALTVRDDPALSGFLELTLERMASQGLRDHLGGGFFRYTVDPGWQVPHFEKMLYDNAQLARVYLMAAKRFARADFAAVARETIDFVLEEMDASGGGFVASLSAVDSAGVEGGYYVWDQATLNRLLDGPERAAMRLLWGLGDGAPDVEAGDLPRISRTIAEAVSELGVLADTLGAVFESARRKLALDRSARSLPVDDKRVTAWNAMVLEALVDAARTLPERERYAGAARRLAGWMKQHLWSNGSLARAWAGGGALGAGTLEDYAYLTRAMMELAELTGSQTDRDFAQTLAEQAWSRFYSLSGWRLDDGLALPGVAGEPVQADGPMPAPAATLILTSLELGGAVARHARQARGEAAAAVWDSPFWHATHLVHYLH